MSSNVISCRLAPEASANNRSVLRSLRVGALVPACIAALVACGGPGGGSNETAGTNPGNGAINATTTFLAYAQASPVPSGSPSPISPSERAELASISRQWAAETLITRDVQFPANAVTLPPLHFGRVLTVGAASAGTTLAELLAVFPAPSSPIVAAGLVRGVYRQVNAGGASVVAAQFMDAVSAKDYPDTWSALSLQPLSAGDLAAVPNLRLEVVDTYSTAIAWPQVTAFSGVFETEAGSRTVVPMIRVTGQIRPVADATMNAVALELPLGRHLVRITPVGSLSGWNVETLVQALATATNAATGAGALAAATGDLVLPVLAGFAARGGDDRRGMGEAMDMVHANLRGMDGTGGNYAELLDGSAALVIDASGMNLNGSMQSRFIFSPTNVNGSGGSGIIISNGGGGLFTVVCGATDIRPSYLAVINALGGVEALARFSTADSNGDVCI